MITKMKISLVFGRVQPKAAVGFPPGRLRWKLDRYGFAKAEVKTESGILLFLVIDCGDSWQPANRLFIVHKPRTLENQNS